MMQPRDFMQERKAKVRLDTAAAADAIVAKITPALIHRNPAVQAAVIAELMAIFIGGHHPKIRKAAFHSLLTMAFDLTEFHDPWKGNSA